MCTPPPAEMPRELHHNCAWHPTPDTALSASIEVPNEVALPVAVCDAMAGSAAVA